MAEPQQCTNVLDAVSDTAVLGIKLAGAVGDNLPSIVANAMSSESILTKIKEALKDIGDAKLKKLSTPSFTEKEALDAAKKVATAGATGAGQAVLNEVKKTREYKDLEASAKKVLDSLACSPVGVFVDENKTWLYIVAAGAAVAGGVAMYVTRSGDSITQPILSALGSKEVSFKPIGDLKVTLGAGDFEFTPSKQEIQGKVFGSIKWQRIEAKVSVTVKAVGSQVTTAGMGQVIIPIRPGLGVTAAGTYDSAKKDYSLAMGVDVNVGGGVKFNIFGGYGNPLSNPAVGKPNVFQDLPGPGGEPAGGNKGMFLGGTLKAEW